MNFVALSFAAMTVLFAVSLISWVVLGMARANDELRLFVDLAPAFPNTLYSHCGVAEQL